jgi:hypothetical protein
VAIKPTRFHVLGANSKGRLMAGKAKPTAQGTWLYMIETEYGAMDGSFELRQAGEELSGDFVNMGARAAIFDGRVDGERLSFNSTLRTRMSVMMLRVEATFKANRMQGMLMTPLGDSPFSARRAKPSKRS